MTTHIVLYKVKDLHIVHKQTARKFSNGTWCGQWSVVVVWLEELCHVCHVCHVCEAPDSASRLRAPVSKNITLHQRVDAESGASGM